jgi:citrate lyase subunit beta/citryl-CoA lyase
MPLNVCRSLLFVPATSTHLLAKAAQRGADALIIDLEDAVPQERKAEARGMAAEAIDLLSAHASVLVRVNSEPDRFRQDLQALPLAALQGILLPKVESAEQVRLLAACLAETHDSAEPLPIVALIETPLGVLRAESIATAHASVCALGFGAEDYASEMLVPAQPQSLLWAAQAVTTCARAFGLVCWGLPGSIAEIEDMDAFAELVRLARASGFTGAVCIHPRQVAVVNAGFGPTEAELSWARRVLAADAHARAQGLGATVLDGRMIDRPIVERARR